MARRFFVGFVGAVAGSFVGFPLASATGHGWIGPMLAIGIGLGSVAVAERQNWIKTREELDKPTKIFGEEN